MILDSITLNNFGAYGGRQHATLTPEPNMPIVLFGGMNGGGKTTLLDAVQLAFYGSRARLSNRGRMAYRDYLEASSHRGKGPDTDSGVEIRFRRMSDGVLKAFELRRHWRRSDRGVQEKLEVWCDGALDESATEHWDEEIEAYLPSGIAHLFFFDGEQVKELAEGGHAAEIIGTAIRSLLGLDLVDRLETDLKVFERRKRAAVLDGDSLKESNQLYAESDQLVKAQEEALMAEGALSNELGRLEKRLASARQRFIAEGGELFNRRTNLAGELSTIASRKRDAEARLRELVCGPLPLVGIGNLLLEVESRLEREHEGKRAQWLTEALEFRDKEIVAALKRARLVESALTQVVETLDSDRRSRSLAASAAILLDADDTLGTHVKGLRLERLPLASERAKALLAEIANLEELELKLEAELERVPSEERIAGLQEEVGAAEAGKDQKLAELATLRIRLDAIRKRKEAIDAKIAHLGEQALNERVSEADRVRILKHSAKVRATLNTFRQEVVRKHTARIEQLMLECFQQLLSKKNLISGLTIDPATFEPRLKGADGFDLPIDRLSAGERQLLATSMLWGLARASGRPVPTIIDTPLGRLDSAHRKNLVERYFPNASHQVILLSTDEEIVDDYHHSLERHIARTYLLSHDTENGATNIQTGYFGK